MNRRDLLSTAAAVAVAIASTEAFADEGGHQEHAHGGHAEHPHLTGMKPQTLVDTATACTKAGLACIDHCLDSFAAGDTAMAACARAVDQMLGMCTALAKIASTGSPHLPMVAKAALAFCADCEKECRKHADQHAVCKACADACASCAEECKKVAV